MTALYCEIDPFAAAWLRELIAQGHIAPGVVTETPLEDLLPHDVLQYDQVHLCAGIAVWSYALRRIGWPDDRRIWSASFPCQPFSAAGKGLGFADERHLWPFGLHLIQQCRPDIIVGEQVASKDGLAWLDVVFADLEASGYAVGAVDLCAAGVGAPHIRQRIWWVAIRLADAERFGHRAQEQTADHRKQETDGPSDRSSGCRVPLGHMEHAPSDGRQQWRPEPSGRSASGGRGLGGLDHHHHTGLEGQRNGHQAESGRDGAVRPVAEAGELGGMADVQGGGWAGQPLHQSGGRSQAGVAGDGGFGRPGPTNGHWRDADWLFCRDGKWRPVEPSYVEVVDGPTRSVGYCGDSGGAGHAKTTEEINARRVLQELRQGTGAQEVQRPAGGQRGVSASGVLQSGMHGCSVRGTNQSDEPEELPSSVGETSAGRLRGLRSESDPAAQPSPERKPAFERWLKLDDVMRKLPQIAALAEQRSDDRTTFALSVLCTTLTGETSVRNASYQAQEVWASLGKEEKNSIRMGLDAFRWREVGTFPLIVGAEARVGRLRGYGNAIVAPLAEEFLRAALLDEPVK